jgi:hypothetical protein
MTRTDLPDAPAPSPEKNPAMWAAAWKLAAGVALAMGRVDPSLCITHEGVVAECEAAYADLARDVAPGN